MILKKKEKKFNDDDLRYLSVFELNPAKTDEEIIGWNGYVDLEGNFYKTKPLGISYYNGSSNLHRDWADAYMLSIGYEDYEIPKNVIINGQTQHIYGCQDWLVYGEGWVSCTFDSECVGIHLNIKGYNSKYLTKAQKEILFKIFKLNNFPMEDYYRYCEDIDFKVNDNEIDW